MGGNRWRGHFGILAVSNLAISRYSGGIVYLRPQSLEDAGVPHEVMVPRWHTERL
jgi:hypothetical protein